MLTKVRIINRRESISLIVAFRQCIDRLRRKCANGLVSISRLRSVIPWETKIEKIVSRAQFTLGSLDRHAYSISKTVTLTYLSALILIAALSLAGYLALLSVIKTQENGLQITKEISHESMLSQRISLLVLRLAVEKDAKKREELMQFLRESISEMKSSHEALIAQESEWRILTRYKDENRDAYLNPPIELDRRIESFLYAAENILTTPSNKMWLHNGDISFLVNAGSDSLLESLHYALKRYEGTTKDRIAFLKTLQLALLLTTLIVLFLEARFVFRPMVSKIQESTRDLNDSAKELMAVIDTVGEGIITCDNDGLILGVNKEVERLWGATKTELIGAPFRQLFSDNEMINSSNIIPSGQWIEKNAKVFSGDVFPVEVHQNQIFVDGKKIGVVAIRDIRSQKADAAKIKKSLDEKKILLQEIHHRVKNNLQIVSSFLSLQSRSLTDKKVKLLFQESQNRVDTMSLIHQELYKSKDISTIDFSIYIKNLTTNLLRTFDFNRSKVSININAKNAFFNIDTAVPCGLIINEVVSNSLEHAFVGLPSGKISIDLISNGERSWKLTITDDGIGIGADVDLTKNKTMGLRLVNALVLQLRGELKIHTESGTIFEIDFVEDIKSDERLKDGIKQQKDTYC